MLPIKLPGPSSRSRKPKQIPYTLPFKPTMHAAYSVQTNCDVYMWKGGQSKQPTGASPGRRSPVSPVSLGIVLSPHMQVVFALFWCLLGQVLPFVSDRMTPCPINPSLSVLGLDQASLCLARAFLSPWGERENDVIASLKKKKKEMRMLLRVNSRVSAKIILVLGPNFGNPQSHGSKTPNRLRKFRNGTCNSNNLEQKYGNTGLSTLHFRTLQIFTITQTRKID